MLDGSVTVDHRLLTESGRAEIIQEQKDLPDNLKSAAEDILVLGVNTAVKLGTGYDVQKFVNEVNGIASTLDIQEQAIFRDLIAAQVEDNRSTNLESNAAPIVVGGAVAAYCAKNPVGCAKVIEKTATALAAIGITIGMSGEEKKETPPKGVPSTSGNSATGMPPNGDDDKKVTKNYEKELNVSAGVARDHLRKNIPGNKAHEAHHIIPWQLRTHPLVQRASKGGFNINGAENGVRLANHRGPHQYYTKRVTDYLNHLEKTNPNMTNQQAANSLKKFTNELKTTLRKMDQPNTRLDGVK